MQVVIPSKENRKEHRDYDEYLYNLRHFVEMAFLYLKRRRGSAAGYAKCTTSFVAFVEISPIGTWVNILK